MDSASNVAAYMIQIGAITLIAELLLRIVPVTAAGFRYAYWRIVLASALIVPWLLRATPPPMLAAEPSAAVAPIAAPIPLVEAQLPAEHWTAGVPDWSGVLLWVLAVGVILRLLWVSAGLVRLRALRHAGAAVDDALYDEIQRALGTRAELKKVRGLAQPVTFGLRRPVVLLPHDLDAAETLRRAVVTHELVHVQRRDWLWVLCEEALRALLWFHPAVWWLTARVRLAREEFTDHLTVLATGSRRAYVEALLSFSEDGGLDPAPAFARRGHLFHRIVLLSKEAAMSSGRIVLSGALIAALFIAGAWHASAWFPILKAPVLEAARQAADLHLPASPRVPVETPAPADVRMGVITGTARQSQSTLGQTEPAAVNPVTPENPIPRRLVSVPIRYPVELEGTNFIGSVEMTVVLNGGGSVASATRGPATVGFAGARSGGAGPTQNGRQVMDILADAASSAIRQWQYDPPARAPLRFYVLVTFRPGQDATISQSDVARGGSAAVGRLVERTWPVGAPPPGGASLPPGAAPAPPVPGQPIRVGGQIKAPTLVRRVNPEYPPIAQSARVQGVVILELVIDEQGVVADARILRSIPLLDQAALAAVRQWAYTPTLLNGVPVPIVMTATVQFTLPPSEPQQ
jgi:TonB family protein